MTAAAKARGSLLWPLAAAAPVFCVLIGLGVWQVERLAWKEGVLAAIDARVHGAPAPLVPASQWPALAAEDYDYTHVEVAGRYDAGVEALIFRGAGQVNGGGSGPGYWVMAPFHPTAGGTLLVNRGFVGLDRKTDPARTAALPAGDTTVVGLLRAPEDRNMFTPADNPATGEWYTRDPKAIAAALRLDKAAPFSIDEDAHPAPAGLPAGGATVFDIPNNHLSYAATWFGLAATLVGVLAVFTWRRARAPS
jgi:surfeit locus 1 family protein